MICHEDARYRTPCRHWVSTIVNLSTSSHADAVQVHPACFKKVRFRMAALLRPSRLTSSPGHRYRERGVPRLPAESPFHARRGFVVQLCAHAAATRTAAAASRILGTAGSGRSDASPQRSGVSAVARLRVAATSRDDTIQASMGHADQQTRGMETVEKVILEVRASDKN